MAKNPAKRKKDQTAPQILKAVIEGLADEFGPRKPEFLSQFREEYRAVDTSCSGTEGHIRVCYVQARVARHYNFRISDEAGVRIEIEDCGLREMSLQNDHLGETYYDLIEPGSIEEMVRWLKSVEYAAARKDQKLHALARENEALKKEVFKLRRGLRDD